jgi:serine/threonine protein kinase
MAFEPGQRAGDYEILEVVGKGGMGCVYRVRNVLSNRTEAMKVLLSNFASEPQLGERFLAEIRTVARLDHPNIARLHTAFQVDNQLVMIMEFVEGASLAEVSKTGPLPLDAVFSYADQILSALAYAHKSGVVHRDIKPSNVMVTPSGVAKLMDFGIAKSTSDPLKTSPGTTMGSVMYMSPEQVRGSDVDARSDLYSFGVLLYELVAGRCPFQSDTTFGILEAHLNAAPKPPIALNPSIPPPLSDLILTALQKEPAMRFSNADAFRNALDFVRHQMGATDPEFAPTVVDMSPTVPVSPKTDSQPIRGTPPVQQPLPPIMGPPARGNRTLWMTMGALACVAALVGAAITLPQFFKPSASSLPQKQKSAVVQPAETSSTSHTSEPVLPAVHEKAIPTPSVDASQRSKRTEHSSGAKPQQVALSTANLSPKAQTQTRSVDDESRQGNPPPPAPAVQTAPPAGPPQADLDRAEDELTKLRARADAVKSSLENLRSQQAASGLGLRQDIASSASLMETYLQAAERGLRVNNLDRAKKSLDSADIEISKLESFFGK